MKKLQWEVYVPLFNNRFILKGLGIAIGIPFGVLITAIIILSKGDIMGTDAKYAQIASEVKLNDLKILNT